MQIADKMSVDLSYVDGRAHEATEDRGLVGIREWDVRRQLEIALLEAIGVIAGEAEPCLRSSDFKAGASILRRYTTVNVGREYGTRLRLSENGDMIGSFTQTLLAGVRQSDDGPENLGPGVNLDDWSVVQVHPGPPKPSKYAAILTFSLTGISLTKQFANHLPTFRLAPRLFVKSMSSSEFHQRSMGSKEDPRRGTSTDSVLHVEIPFVPSVLARRLDFELGGARDCSRCDGVFQLVD
jgi:hypothetical protein